MTRLRIPWLPGDSGHRLDVSYAVAVLRARSGAAAPPDFVLCPVVVGALMMAEGPFVRSDLSGEASGPQLGFAARSSGCTAASSAAS